MKPSAISASNGGSVEQQGTCGWIGPGYPHMDGATGITGRHDDLRVEPDLAKPLRAVVGGLRLAHRLGGVPPIAGVDADELLRQGDDLALDVGQVRIGLGCRDVRHVDILPAFRSSVSNGRDSRPRKGTGMLSRHTSSEWRNWQTR
jgi:hypothetical protein